MRQTHVTLNGHRVDYRVAGDPALPVLLLIHGITSTSATWDPVIPALAEHAHVIAPDQFGHGHSLDAFVNGLRDLLLHLGPEHVTIVGHSLGGSVAIQFADQYPEHCDRLVLVSSGGLGREVSGALRAATLPGAEFALPLIANAHVRDAEVAVARLLRRLGIRPRPSMVEVARGYATLVDKPARRAFVHTLRSVVELGGQRVLASDPLDQAGDRPTLIVWGALDTVIPVAHAYAAHSAIPGSRLEIFEQSGHFPHLDEPDRFAQVLLSFLTTTQPIPIDHTPAIRADTPPPAIRDRPEQANQPTSEARTLSPDLADNET